MQQQRATQGCCGQRAQPVVAVLKRSLPAKESSSQRRSHEQRVAAKAYNVVSTTSRPANPALQQDIRLTSAQPTVVGQQPDEQLHLEQTDELFLAKAWNFLLGASGVFLFPYIPIFLQSRGFSPAQIGLLAALRPWLAAPVSMTTSALADKHKAHVKLLLASAALGVVLRSSMPLAGGGVLLTVLLLAGELTGASTGVLGDATVLSNCKDPGDYGKQRQWGSIGFGLLSKPAGYVIQHTGITSAFVIYGLASVPLLYIGSKLTYQYTSAGSITNSSTSTQQSSDAPSGKAASISSTQAANPLKKLEEALDGSADVKLAVEGRTWQPCTAQEPLMQPAVLLFLWRCLLAGFGFGVMASYEFLFLKELGAPETLMGMALMASVCTEVPAFMLQGTILKHVSAPTLLNIALATTALRLAAYAALPELGNTWAVLPVELLHGITFGIFFCTATVYSSKLAPPKLGATMQGMFQSTYGGVSAGLGGLLGGVLMENLGGQGLFAASAAIVAAGGVMGLVADQAVAVLHKSRLPGAVTPKAE